MTASSVELAPTAVVASVVVSDADGAQAQTVSAATVTTTGVPAQFKNLFDEHNRYRALHGVAALTWSTTLANAAGQHAGKCVVQPGTNTAQGETLATAGIDMLDRRGVNAFETSRLVNTATHGMFLTWLRQNPETGGYQYHQVVWKAATQIGCAMKTCAIGGAQDNLGEVFLVCRYNKRATDAPKDVSNNVPLLSATHTLPERLSFSTTKNDLPGATGANVNCLTSANKVYKLCLQPADGQLVLTNTKGSKKPLWTTNILYADPTGADGDGPKDQLVHMLTQSIGTLSVYLPNGGSANPEQAKWFSNVPGGTAQEIGLRSPTRLVVEDTGSLRIYSVANEVLWTN